MQAKLNAWMPDLAGKLGLEPYLVTIQACADNFLARVDRGNQRIILNSRYIRDLSDATSCLVHAMANYRDRNNACGTRQS